MARQSEDNTQIAIVKYLREVLPADALVAHVPNGGKRSIAQAARFKAMGVVAGIPDLIVLVPVGRAIFFEVKRPAGVNQRKGSESVSQLAMRFKLNGLGFDCATVYGIDDVRNALRALNVRTREAA